MCCDGSAVPAPQPSPPSPPSPRQASCRGRQFCAKPMRDGTADGEQAKRRTPRLLLRAVPGWWRRARHALRRRHGEVCVVKPF